ncbi:toll/interleukin-1 receptor domain-containing protein [Thiorhodovibrio frisius]|uniref:TIR domain-containing protein n=1 Tax=Thiorhodovibrio frisius TaxID=631362 RepID=H8YWY8_9GAMM|nr:toll/interleukin-1 receptor domain-containing protein [Thiorhodovibrio frisius]EIC22964.1 hypothetical protein Thi970DRAFT_00608 [Thiorhodovibrio frisius]WPL22775.1 hypothetical protein Thiofri_02945 [Thiorhodovibrio frisius]
MLSQAIIDNDDDLFWGDLLLYIEEQQVVPVIGEPLLKVEDEDGQIVALNQLLAARLAEKLRLRPQQLPSETPSLNEVVTTFMQNRGRREQIYPRLKAVMNELELRPWLPLQQLADIEAFQLYITLGFDTLVEQALQQARHLSDGQWQSFAYSPHTPNDLSDALNEMHQPVIYHLLGRISAGPDYVLTDEDRLEFLYALPSKERRPPYLFDALRDNHLLLLGGQQSSWMMQFLLRTIKGQPLSQQRSETEVLVDLPSASNVQLIGFLEHYSYNTRILGQNLAAFIDQLHQQWRQRHPKTDNSTAAIKLVPPVESRPDMEPGALFISYASEDRAAAQTLRDALDRVGIDAWFDQKGLEAGDDYALKIRRHIHRSALFVPLISANTTQRVEGFFRREWRWAADRAEAIADGVPFILPVVIDKTDPYSDQLPEAITKAHWSTLPDGQADDAFLQRIVELVRNYRRQQR